MPRLYILLVLICVLVFPLFAVEWDELLSDIPNLEIVSLSSDGNNIQARKNIAGNMVDVSIGIAGDDYELYAKKLLTLTAHMDSFMQIIPRKLEIIIQDQSLVMYLVPQYIPSGEENATKYLPSGNLRFYYEKTLEYDFYLRIDNLMLNLKGRFFNEMHLLSRIQKALADPIFFLSSEEPSFLTQRISELQDELVELQQATVPNIISTQQESEERILTELKDELRSMTTKINTLQESIDEEILITRRGQIALYSGRTTSAAEIQDVLAEYQRDPNLSASKIRSALSAKHKLTTKQIRAVIAVFTGNFIKFW